MERGFWGLQVLQQGYGALWSRFWERTDIKETRTNGRGTCVITIPSEKKRMAKEKKKEERRSTGDLRNAFDIGSTKNDSTRRGEKMERRRREIGAKKERKTKERGKKKEKSCDCWWSSIVSLFSPRFLYYQSFFPNPSQTFFSSLFGEEKPRRGDDSTRELCFAINGETTWGDSLGRKKEGKKWTLKRRDEGSSHNGVQFERYVEYTVRNKWRRTPFLKSELN